MDSDNKPLSEMLRPSDLTTFIGQNHLLGENSILTMIMKEGKPVSLLFFGPPGCGKTTMAEIVSEKFRLPVLKINGVSFSTQSFKKIVQETKDQSILIIIDEIHRMNKGQQDALLPYVENGRVYIIGTTTENPSFEINKALLSRVTVLEFEKLSYEDLKRILSNAFKKLSLTAKNEQILDYIIDFSNYDARQALNILNTVKNEINRIESAEAFKKLLSRKFIPHDKKGEEHYNLISAFHKSVRGSDVNASIYYFARMVAGGEDPLYIGRRMIRITSEDIGNADPQAMQIALNAYEVYEKLGSPEGELALLQATVYLALAPKSTAVYKAFSKSMNDAKRSAHLPVPLKLRNAVTDFDEERGYGEDYKYPPDFPFGFVPEGYFPDGMYEKEYYKPVERGFERDMKKRMEYYRKLKEELSKNSS